MARWKESESFVSLKTLAAAALWPAAEKCPGELQLSLDDSSYAYGQRCNVVVVREDGQYGALVLLLQHGRPIPIELKATEGLLGAVFLSECPIFLGEQGRMTAVIARASEFGVDSLFRMYIATPELVENESEDPPEITFRRNDLAGFYTPKIDFTKEDPGPSFHEKVNFNSIDVYGMKPNYPRDPSDFEYNVYVEGRPSSLNLEAGHVQIMYADDGDGQMWRYKESQYPQPQRATDIVCRSESFSTKVIRLMLKPASTRLIKCMSRGIEYTSDYDEDDEDYEDYDDDDDDDDDE